MGKGEGGETHLNILDAEAGRKGRQRRGGRELTDKRQKQKVQGRSIYCCQFLFHVRFRAVLTLGQRHSSRNLCSKIIAEHVRAELEEVRL